MREGVREGSREMQEAADERCSHQPQSHLAVAWHGSKHDGERNPIANANN